MGHASAALSAGVLHLRCVWGPGSRKEGKGGSWCCGPGGLPHSVLAVDSLVGVFSGRADGLEGLAGLPLAALALGAFLVAGDGGCLGVPVTVGSPGHRL